VIGGHTHAVTDRVIDGIRALNPRRLPLTCTADAIPTRTSSRPSSPDSARKTTRYGVMTSFQLLPFQ
jgi:hypothetical protein